jgi:spore coat polysaccharide biosynthesis protein SpsF (cytidylyltransferase family)
MEGRVLVIVQARMGSHRFLGKVLAGLCGQPVIQHVIERCKKAGPTVLAIPSTDIEIVEAVGGLVAIYYHPGDENDVLSRYYHAAKAFKADVVTRVTGDCPMIDPGTIEAVVRLRDAARADYCANEPYIPGFGLECFTFEALEEAYVKSTEREHVTTYMRPPTTLMSGARLVEEDKYRPGVNLSIDTPKDLERVRQIMTDLGIDCRTKEIVQWIDMRH